MSAPMPWFRMYVDFLNDPKLISLAFEDQRHFIGVLALKSDGALDSACDPDLLDRIVAQRLWIDHAIIRDVKKRLVAAGLIDAAWQPLAWDRRQFKSDSSKDRVARFRAKKKDSASAGNGDETLLKRPSNAVDTDTDTEADTDKEETVKELVVVGGGHAADDAAPAAPPEPSKSKTATRLPDDWVLQKAWGDWALSERPDMTPEDVRREADCFADYWRAKGGADARKVDWQATWRNWIRRCDGKAPGARGSSHSSKSNTGETAYQRSMRERMQEVCPSIARQAPEAPAADFFKSQAIEVQARCIEQPQKQIGGAA